MKRILLVWLLGLLAAGSLSAQATPTAPGLGIRPGRSANPQAPVTNPEPMTLVALAGGAALAGGLLRRRKSTR